MAGAFDTQVPYIYDATNQLWKAKGRTSVSTAGGGTFVLGTTKPDSTNTGVPLGQSLTVHNGDYVVTTPGTVIDSMDIFGFVRVQAANVTISNCRIRGRDTGYQNVISGTTLPNTTGSATGGGICDPYARKWPGWYGLVDAKSSACKNLLITRCTIAPDYPAWWVIGVDGHDYTVDRCDISGTNDGVQTSGNSTIQGSYIHDNCFTACDYDQKNSSGNPWWSHDDAIVITGTGNVTAQGNFLKWDAGPTAMLSVLDSGGYSDHHYGGDFTIAPDNSAVNNVLITQNWFKGATCGFQANYTNSSKHAGASDYLGEISYNQFAMDQHNYSKTVSDRYQIRYQPGWTIDKLTTNIWDPNDPSVPVALRGVAFSEGFATGIRVNGID